MTIDRKHIEALKEISGSKGWTEDQDVIEPQTKEPRKKFFGKTPLLLLPNNTSAVSRIMKYCNENKIKIVPQGGNTGLVGGSIPDNSGNEILLNLKRLNKLRQFNTLNHTITVEAGMILSDIHGLADNEKCQFPLHIASEGSAMIGGNISTNAGGINVLRYGMTRELILGLEVVLPNGDIWNGLSDLKKDNTGYDLKHLFIGAEGTLGVITAASLKLYPAAMQRHSAFVAVSDLDAATKLLGHARDISGDTLIAFEIMPRIGIDFTVKHIEKCRDPLAEKYEWYILMECATSMTSDLMDLKKVMERILETAFEEGLVLDGVVPKNISEINKLWDLRHHFSEAQSFEGGSIKHDIAVSVSQIPAFLTQATAAVKKAIPGIRPVPFGHVGDGNIHFNLSQPIDMDTKEYLDKWEDVSRIVHDITAEFNGSLGAEHGIGILKLKELEYYKSDVDLNMMRSLKKALDPNNILNPGRVIR